jgi:hypothetical protein
MNQNLTTLSHRVDILRVISSENAVANPDGLTVLDLTTSGNYANRRGITLDVKLGGEMKQNGLAFMFAGSGGENKTFDYRLFNWRNENGPAKQVAYGTGILGTQNVVVYPHNDVPVTTLTWADTLTVTWFNWYKEVYSTDTTGHNTMAEVWLDGLGHRHWYCEIITTGTSDPATNIVVYYGYF